MSKLGVCLDARLISELWRYLAIISMWQNDIPAATIFAFPLMLGVGLR